MSLFSYLGLNQQNITATQVCAFGF